MALCILFWTLAKTFLAEDKPCRESSCAWRSWKYTRLPLRRAFGRPLCFLPCTICVCHISPVGRQKWDDFDWASCAPLCRSPSPEMIACSLKNMPRQSGKSEWNYANATRALLLSWPWIAIDSRNRCSAYRRFFLNWKNEQVFAVLFYFLTTHRTSRGRDSRYRRQKHELEVDCCWTVAMWTNSPDNGSDLQTDRSSKRKGWRNRPIQLHTSDIERGDHEGPVDERRENRFLFG